MMPNLTLAHDYFLQHGGAERVAASWMNYYEQSSMHTLAFDPRATFSSVDESRVHAKLYGKFWTNHLHKLLPALPRLASDVSVTQGDVALVSTSGWAHQFTYEVPTVAYVHSPARWLYAESDYRLGLSLFAQAGLRASASYLKGQDIPAMQRMSRVVSNSKVTQQRIWNAYKLESAVVSPPVSPLSETPVEPSTKLPSRYLLIVARNRGYKRLDAAAEVARRCGRALVIIGSGTETINEPESAVYGLGRVSDGELRWLYRNADLLLATAHEDFGLTVLEANYEGTPVVAIPAGGYLETVRNGVNGVLATNRDLGSFGPAVQEAISISGDSCRSWAENFSLANHMLKIQGIIDDL